MWIFSFKIKKMTSNICIAGVAMITGITGQLELGEELARNLSVISISSVIVLFNDNLPDLWSYMKSLIKSI